VEVPAGSVSRVVAIRTLKDTTVDEGWEGMRLYITASVGAPMGDRVGWGNIPERTSLRDARAE
jgi:hypothetical protein